MSSGFTMSSSMEEELEITRLCLGIGGAEAGGRSTRNEGPATDGGSAGGARKKLRLTGEQAALLENSFRAHNIPSHGEKHYLARRVGLRPRQVEVWFQNRRARTKLKQTELDRNLMRRRCEQLSHENARLRWEIAMARSSSSAVPTLTATVNSAAATCPSCSKKLAGGLIKHN